MRVRVDGGGRTFLPICACGWRGLPGITHGEALREARTHERRAHPGDDQAAQALAKHRSRHAG